MGYEFECDKPIYIQIEEKIKTDIVSKKYLPKEKLPSVRDFSSEFEVNPNTVQKALSELENTGIIYTESTNGKYVTENEELIEKVKREIIEKKINGLYSELKSLGLKESQIAEILRKER